jgi:sulfatase maturation enzyme AslB (radical SAM superfamily)
VHLLTKLVPEAEATYPQTQIVNNVFANLKRAFRTEVYAGRFDDIPYQTLIKLKDRNFQRFLEFSEKLLVYLSENDRYYRQWLGLALILGSKEIQKIKENLTYKEFVDFMQRQWEMNLREAVPQAVFESHREDFVGQVLTDFLVNLV